MLLQIQPGFSLWLEVKDVVTVRYRASQQYRWHRTFEWSFSAQTFLPCILQQDIPIAGQCWHCWLKWFISSLHFMVNWLSNPTKPRELLRCCMNSRQKIFRAIGLHFPGDVRNGHCRVSHAIACQQCCNIQRDDCPTFPHQIVVKKRKHDALLLSRIQTKLRLLFYQNLFK